MGRKSCILWVVSRCVEWQCQGIHFHTHAVTIAVSDFNNIISNTSKIDYLELTFSWCRLGLDRLLHHWTCCGSKVSFSRVIIVQNLPDLHRGSLGLLMRIPVVGGTTICTGELTIWLIGAHVHKFEVSSTARHVALMYLLGFWDPGERSNQSYNSSHRDPGNQKEAQGPACFAWRKLQNAQHGTYQPDRQFTGAHCCSTDYQ